MSGVEPRLGLSWRPRSRPLAPVAAFASGPAALALVARLLERDDEALRSLRGVGGAGIVTLLGDSDALPWADGVVYLGHDPASPSLLLPTNSEPLVPLPLLERAVLTRLRDPQPPVVLLASPPIMVSTGAARPLHRGRLRAWRERQR